jgi:L-lactate dehydrogenase (cytochrome)
MVLRDVRERVGDSLQLILDSGVRTGSDIAAAVALGADACAIGRAYLYGLAAGGEPGVSHALGLLDAELRRTMRMLGVKTIDELKQTGPTLVGLRRDASALMRPVMHENSRKTLNIQEEVA